MPRSSHRSPRRASVTYSQGGHRPGALGVAGGGGECVNLGKVSKKEAGEGPSLNGPRKDLVNYCLKSVIKLTIQLHLLPYK